MSTLSAPPRRRTRGRPKSERPKHDYGTSELIAKRLHGETSEALDLCLERGIITPEQHWCGIHLRWLYTLRFGTPSIQATPLHDTAQTAAKLHDPKWQASCEQEYQEAITLLTQGGYAVQMANICIFNETPHFLKKPSALNRPVVADAERLRFLDGLDVLVRCWEK